MTLTDVTVHSNGWDCQAENLTLAHGALGMVVVTVAKQLRRPPLIDRVISERNTNTKPGPRRETSKTGRSDEFELSSAKLSELERQAAPKKVISRLLNWQRNAPTAQVLAAARPVATPKQEFDPSSDDRDRWQNENDSLQTSLDLIINENSHLCHCLVEKDTAIDDAYAELEQVRAALAAAEKSLAETRLSLLASAEANAALIGENVRLSRRLAASDVSIEETRSALEQMRLALTMAEADHEKLASAVEEANKKLRAETESYQACVEDLSSRAEAAETMLAVVRQSLVNKLDSLQAWHQAKIRRVKELEDSRSKLIDGTGALLNIVNTRDKALAQTREAIKLLIDCVTNPKGQTKVRIEPHSAGMLLADTITF
jgi:chromosome segregation ATPase